MSNIDLAAIEKLQNELLVKRAELRTKISKVLELLVRQRAMSLNITKPIPVHTKIGVLFIDDLGSPKIDIKKINNEDHICYVADSHGNGSWFYSDWPKDWSSPWYSMPVRWLTASEPDLIAEVSAVFKKHEANKALKIKKAKASVEKTSKSKKIAAAKMALNKLSEKERQDLFDVLYKEAG